MDILQNLTDDQIVIIGATLTLACCVGLMYLSHAFTGSSDEMRQTAKQLARPVPHERDRVSSRRDAA